MSRPLAHLATIAGLALLVGALPAHAQAPTNFVVEQFEPLPSQGTNILNIGKSEVLPHLRPSFGLSFHYQDDPFLLVLQNDESNVQQHLIDWAAKGEVWAALGLFDVLDVGLVMPLVLGQSGSTYDPTGGNDTIEGFATGDLRIVPKLRILKNADFGGFGLAVLVPISLPTGDEDTYNSEGTVRVEPRLALDWRSDGGFVVAANVAYQPRAKRAFLNYENDDVLKWGVGLEVPIVEDLQLIGTVFGSVGVGAREDATHTDPVEALGGVQYWFADGWVVNAGAGGDLSGGVGSPDVRIFATIGYTPRANDRDKDGIDDADDACPKDPEDFDGYQDGDGCPEADNDQDGILDMADGAIDASGFGRCRNNPEDKDGFEDGDGCPEADNDLDGVLDVVDGTIDASGFGACRDVPEDKDGFEDGDGCPDLDNDKDGVPDVRDGAVGADGFGICRDMPEDVDGWEDLDGCPELDNDKDGIADLVDKCPNQPETKNGFEDEDGCPDTTLKFVRITERQIVILKKVFFAYNRDTIKKESYGILDEVTKVLLENPWIDKISVDGHTDTDGNDAYNLDLSTRRAASVMLYLQQHGVDPARLSSRGYGETMPLASNATPKGRADNRRVEFNILSANGKNIEVIDVDNRSKTIE